MNGPQASPVAVIITAIREEFLAVRRHLRSVEEVRHPNGTVYDCGTFAGTISGNWRVAIAEVGPGNAVAAFEAERAISHFDPAVVLFVGVAGGIKDVNLGDVVAATKVYGFEAGKAGENFLPRPDVGQSSYQLVQRARAEARSNDWTARLPEPCDHPPRVFVAPIAAGEKVVASTKSQIYGFIKAAYGDALAVEMEGRGTLVATHANHPVHALIVRGISDMVDEKSVTDSQGYQRIAAQNASAFAFQILARLDTAANRNAELRTKLGVFIAVVVLIVAGMVWFSKLHTSEGRRLDNSSQAAPQSQASIRIHKSVDSLLGATRRLDRLCLALGVEFHSEQMSKDFTAPAEPVGMVTRAVFVAGRLQEKAKLVRIELTSAAIMPIDDQDTEALSAAGVEPATIQRYKTAIEAAGLQGRMLQDEIDGLQREWEGYADINKSPGSKLSIESALQFGIWRIEVQRLLLEASVYEMHLQLLRILTQLCGANPLLEKQVEGELLALKVLIPRRLLTGQLEREADEYIRNLQQQAVGLIKQIRSANQPLEDELLRKIDQLAREYDDFQALPGDTADRVIIKAIVARNANLLGLAVGCFQAYGRMFSNSDTNADEFVQIASSFTYDPASAAPQRSALYVYLIKAGSEAIGHLQVGDIILKGNGEFLRTSGDFIRFAEKHGGEEAEFEILRWDGSRLNRKTVRFTLPRSASPGIGISHV